MLDNDMLNINLNKYEYFMNHLVFNRNESFAILSPVFTPIRYTKEVNLDLYDYSLNDFEIILKMNPFYSESYNNIVEFPYPKFSEILQITTELYPNPEYISEWNLNRFFSLDTYKIDNSIHSYNEQYQLVKLFDDDKKKIQFRKLTEDLNNFIINKYGMDEDDINLYGKFLDDYDYNFKFQFSEIQKFDFDEHIVKNENGEIVTYNKETLKEELYNRIKQKISFDFVIQRNNIKLNMVLERKLKRRNSNKNITYLFTTFNVYDEDGDPFKIIILGCNIENDILSESKLMDYIESVNNQYNILNWYDFQDVTFDLLTQLRVNNSIEIKILDYDETLTHYEFEYDFKQFMIYDQWDIVLVDNDENELTDSFYFKKMVIPYEQIIKEKVTPNNKTNIFNRNITHKSTYDTHKDKRIINILK